MLEAYLRSLEGELARRLPQEDVQARLTEAEAHLREGMEARIELGLEAEEAAREAIRAFGAPRQMAEAAVFQAAPRLAPRLRWLVWGYGLGAAFFHCALRLQDRYPASIVALFVVWSVIGFAFAVCSYRARRPAPLAIARAGGLGAIAVWLVIGTSWIDLRPYGSKGMLPPGGAEGTMRESSRLVSDWETLEEGMRKLKGPRGIEAMRSSGGYRAPVVGSNWNREGRLAFTTVKDPLIALVA